MVKNKGFTLVELLAVIVIIGATSILIVPKLIERFEVKKEDLNKQAKELLYLAASQYMDLKQDDNISCISLKELIELKNTTVSTVQSTIDTEIKAAYTNAKIIAADYGNLYERDLGSDMYKVENATTFFLTDDGYVYIIYPYGNTDYTNEMDIVIF